MPVPFSSYFVTTFYLFYTKKVKGYTKVFSKMSKFFQQIYNMQLIKQIKK